MRERKRERDSKLLSTLSCALQKILALYHKIIPALHTNLFFDPEFCDALLCFIFSTINFAILWPKGARKVPARYLAAPALSGSSR